MTALMLVIASFVWGGGTPPPCGQPTVEVGPVPVRAAGYADLERCRAVVAPGLSRRWTCAIVLHEVGHLYGQPHAATGVMRAVLMTPPALCRRLFRGP